jgi:hypothetical protein
MHREINVKFSEGDGVWVASYADHPFMAHGNCVAEAVARLEEVANAWNWIELDRLRGLLTQVVPMIRREREEYNRFLNGHRIASDVSTGYSIGARDALDLIAEDIENLLK